MNPKYVEPLVASTMSVFSTMLGCELVAGAVTDDATREGPHDVTGIIGMSGKMSGVVMIHISKDIALNITAAMLGGKPTEINADVIDAVGELTNMIAGGAKARLAPMFENLALPMVLVGGVGSIGFPSRTQPTCIAFTSPWGPLSVEIDVKQSRFG